MHKIVFAPDSFKGTMTSIQVCDILEKAFRKIKPGLETVKIPIADGGEGTVDAFLRAVGGEKIFVGTKNPLFEDIDSFYGIINNGKIAVIEMAAASGLPLIENRKNPLDASTFGTGLLIKDALDRGCEKIILGLGGSATNDGGIGIMAALGVKFLDKNMREIIPSNRGLCDLKYIDGTGLDKRLKFCEITVACDVDNILCGKNGASYVFGPQKGADENTVKILDENLSRYAEILFEKTGRDVQNIPGTGAAGGVLASLLSFTDCKVCPGIDIILDAANFDGIIKDADLIVTGEGKFDSQSLRGKVVSGIAKRAKKQNKPVVVIAGDVREYGEEVYDSDVLGIRAVFGVCSGVYTSFDEIRQTCFEDLRRTGENIARILW